MITKLHIENFKSLVDFDLPPNGYELDKFTCLIGLNGSGKSTLLQAFDFISRLVTGDVTEWLAQRDWKPRELVSHLEKKRSPVISFKVALRDSNCGLLTWEGKFNYVLMRCTFESIRSMGAEGESVLLEVIDGKFYIAGAGGLAPAKHERLSFTYNGSVLSAAVLNDAAPGVRAVKDTLTSLKSLELLSPQLMRRRARKDEDIGAGGEKLSAFLGAFPPDQRNLLLGELREFYPALNEWTVKSLVFGWKNLRFAERYGNGLSVGATHINDGLLRVMAILAQAQSSHSILLFDEIENGINPELVEKLMAFLIDVNKQVIVTTHSPLILNYIPDDIAKRSVMLLYKREDGRTRCIRFFDLPQPKEKLRSLGPGEVFADTRLAEIIP